MSKIDDSALLHRAPYDPVKAHEYYIKNRQIKGRVPGAAEVPNSQSRSRSALSSPNRRSKTSSDRASGGKSRSAQMEVQKEMLEKRLDRLRDILAQKVKVAKARSGIKNDPVDKDESPAEKAAKNEANKKESALTVKQKRDKAAKAREEYKKEHGGDTSLSSEIAQLQRQIVDIRAKIQTAIQDAREKSAQSKTQTASKGR